MKNPLTMRLIAAAALAGCMTWSSAGTISLAADPASPFSVGTVTFTVRDSSPRDMSDSTGFVAGDFSLLYDPEVLEFLEITYPDWVAASTFSVFGNGALPGEVLVNLIGIDVSGVPDGPADLFAVSFNVKPALGSSVSVVPYLGDPPAPSPSYAFDSVSLPFAINAVPLPSTAALAALGLLAAGMATRRSRCPTRS